MSFRRIAFSLNSDNGEAEEFLIEWIKGLEKDGRGVGNLKALITEHLYNSLNPDRSEKDLPSDPSIEKDFVHLKDSRGSKNHGAVEQSLLDRGGRVEGHIYPEACAPAYDSDDVSLPVAELTPSKASHSADGSKLAPPNVSEPTVDMNKFDAVIARLNF